MKQQTHAALPLKLDPSPHPKYAKNYKTAIWPSSSSVILISFAKSARLFSNPLQNPFCSSVGIISWFMDGKKKYLFSMIPPNSNRRAAFLGMIWIERGNVKEQMRILFSCAGIEDLKTNHSKKYASNETIGESKMLIKVNFLMKVKIILFVKVKAK